MSNVTITGNTFDSTYTGNSLAFYSDNGEYLFSQNNDVTGVGVLSGTAPTITHWNSTAPVTYTYKGTEYTGFPGNHWSDLSGEDSDGDGIIDTPYGLPDSLGTDFEPLAGAWEDGTIVEYGDGSMILYVDDDGGADFITIQAAVDSAPEGGTIIVKDGSYNENVDLDKAVTVMSENGCGNVTVTAVVPTTPVFELLADNVTVRGFTTRGPTNEHVASIENVGYSNCLITGNDCSGCYNGIHLGGDSTNCTIAENYCHENTRRGISLRDTAHGNYVYDNYCTGNADDQLCIKDGTHDNYIWKNKFNGTVECLTSNVFNTTEPVVYTYKGTIYTGFVGNFWSDYAGTDTDDDGIGDSIYTLPDGFSTDYAPLIGAWDNGTITENVIVPDIPVADFIASVTYGVAPLTVTFTDTSTNSPESWLWDFGDGTNSGEQNPVHIYNTAGIYTASLNATNTAGSSVTTISIIVIAGDSGENSTITLNHGWNFVSTPKTLADGADTFSIFNDVDTAEHSILLYDAEIGRWTAMSSDDEFEPLDGIWIYSNDTCEIPLQYARGSVQAPPLRDLFRGWNAIGLSDNIPESTVNTLLSVEDEWTTIIGFDGAAQEYGVSITKGGTEIHSDEREMNPLQGYWVYMTDNDTICAISA